METTILPGPVGRETNYVLENLVVAYDGSPAAEQALMEAVLMGKRYDASIILAHITPPEEPTNSFTEIRAQVRQNADGLDLMAARILAGGVTCRTIVRGGIVGDVLFDICCEQNADLLFMGAYGLGQQDRETLGSTAEFLLRAIPCPTLTYGPHVHGNFLSMTHKGPALLPIALPCTSDEIRQSVALARLFGFGVELIHINDQAHSRSMHDLELQMEELTHRLRSAGECAQWSLFCGAPETIITARAQELGCPFIVMPLHWRNRLSSLTDDNVAAHVIRTSTMPVMTLRVP